MNEETSDDLREALNAFKKRVESQVQTPAYFRSPEDLALRVLQNIRAWENRGRPGGRQVFGTREEFFSTDTRPTKYFNHDSALRGRDSHLEALNAFLANPQIVCALMDARGGQGKTKLLHDWTSSVSPSWHVLFVRPLAIWHSQASRELPASGNMLIVLDDAHREPDLFGRLLVLANGYHQAQERRLKILLAYRPSGHTALNSIAARRVGSDAFQTLPKLVPLSARDLRQIAEDILPDELRHHAVRLATIAGDSPLVVSVGARLLMAGELRTDVLSDERFRDEVLSRFYDDYTNGNEVRDKRPLLNLIAAVGPVPEQAAWFANAAAGLLNVLEHEVLQGCDALKEHGLVVNTRGGLRVVPDVLSDYLFRLASLTMDGTPTGYVEDLFAAFSRTPVLGHLLTNASELSWNLQQAGINFRPNESIWAGLRHAVREGDSYTRAAVLRAIRNAAFYEPGQALELVGEFMDTAAEDDNVIEILKSVAWNPSHTAKAVEYLWKLALVETRRENSHPTHAGRVLRELAGFGVHKHKSVNERLLAIAEHRATDSSWLEGSFTPLDIADAILEKEVEHSESDDDTLYLSSIALNYEVVKELRDRALWLIRTALNHENPVAQARAVQSLQSVLGGLIGSFGRVPSDEELSWQDSERLVAIGFIAERVSRADTSTPLMYCLRRALVDVRGRPGSPATPAARAALRRVPRSDALRIFTAVCIASWDHWDKPRRFEERVGVAAEKLVERCARPTERVTYLSSLTESAEIFGVFQDTGARALCGELCRDNEFLAELTSRILTGETKTLTRYLTVVISRLRSSDPAKCVALVTESLSHANIDVRAAAVHGIAFRGGDRSELDVRMLAAGGANDSAFVRSLAIKGLGLIPRHHPELARQSLDALLGITPHGNPNNVESWCDALSSAKAQLNSEDVSRALRELVGVDALKDYHVGELLQSLASSHPSETAHFLLQRLAEDSNRVEDHSYSYRPVPEFMRHNLHALGKHSPTTLGEVRDRLVTAAPHARHELIDMFWAMGGSTSEALSYVDDWLHSSEPERVADALDLISAAPNQLSLQRPTFAGHVIEIFRHTDFFDRARGALISNCRPDGWSGRRGAVPAEHAQILDSAKKLAVTWQGTFVAEAMSAIVEVMERTIQAIVKEYET